MSQALKNTLGIWNRFSSLRGSSFSNLQLLIFVLMFGLIGYFVYDSFASSPPIATLQAEQMSLPPGAKIRSGTAASGGEYVVLTTNGTATGTVNLPSPATSLSVIARGPQCNGAPQMQVAVDGKTLINVAVTYTKWHSFSTAASLASGSHQLAITFSNDYTISGVCSRDLAIDVTNFYGATAPPPAPPTVSLSASPSSLTAGQAATLTWSSTNATGCTASGAWSGSEPTSGSTSTGALNQTSTYSMTCTGSGGSASASVTVTVSSSSGSGVTPPTPPSAYALPTTATDVSTTAGLISALSASTRDIILENGTYTNASSLLIGNHRLWARSLGGATLNFGLQIGGNGSGSGGEVHGLKLDISNAAATSDKAAIQIWGTTAGQNAVVADSWIYGHSVLTFGIEDRTTSGFKAQRLIMSDFVGYGVFFETYYPNYYTDAPAVEPLVSDIDVSHVSYATPGGSNGTAEAGIWAGTDCLCNDIKVRNTGWMGIWLGGNANNGVYSNLDIDQIQSDSVGIYLEHYSRSNTFKNFIIGGSSGGSGVRVGFNCEWADPAYAGTNPVAGQSIAACHYNTIENGTIYSHYRGIQLEDAQATTISQVKFIGQSNAAIDDYMTSGSGQTTTWQNLGNDFAGLQSGAVPYTTGY